jgi:DNA invertase Pin-like site-specific DNA recombinase
MATKAVGMIRVSTDEQAEDGHSLDAQRAKIEAYCKLYDIELVAILEGAGESAKTLDRPALQEALGMLDSGEADGLVVASLDRLSRSVKDWNCLIEDYFGERAGKQLFSVSDSVDTRTAAGRMVLNMLMTVYQWQRENIAEKTKEVLRHKIRNGERVGRVRYGYSLNAEGRLVENPAEQAAILLMRAMRDAGATYRRICERLDEGEYPTQEGRPWVPMTVKRILERSTGVLAAA